MVGASPDLIASYPGWGHDRPLRVTQSMRSLIVGLVACRRFCELGASDQVKHPDGPVPANVGMFCVGAMAVDGP